MTPPAYFQGVKTPNLSGSTPLVPKLPERSVSLGAGRLA